MHQKSNTPQSGSPPCDCRLKNDNANGLSFRKGNLRLEPIRPDLGMPDRPPRRDTVGLGISQPTILLQGPPKWSLSWQSDSTRPDPRKLRTPKKLPDRKGYA